jgi:hypothetical protein
MKLLVIVALFACVVSAQSIYTATSGEITLTAMAWSSSIVPTAVSAWRPVVVTGTWITACTSGQSTPKAVIITQKSGTDVVKTVEDFGYINNAGNGLRCGNILSLVKRESIISVSVVTASADFTDLN